MDTQILVNAIIPIIVAIAFAFVAGGTTVAAVLLIALSMILKSPVILSTLEKLYMALPPDWQQVVKEGVQVGDQIVAPAATNITVTPAAVG